MEQTLMDFIPAQGLEKDILAQKLTQGYFYVATDTGKMYTDILDKDSGELVRKAIGGSGAAIIYAQIPNLTVAADGVTYLVKYNQLVQDSPNPNVGDLIINLPDGKFLKVEMLEEIWCQCSLVAISGTGNRPGGPGGDIEVDNSYMKLETKEATVVMQKYGDCILSVMPRVWNVEGTEVSGPHYPVFITVVRGTNDILLNTVLYPERTYQDINLKDIVNKIVNWGIKEGTEYIAVRGEYTSETGVIHSFTLKFTIKIVNLTLTEPDYECGQSFNIL